MLDVVVKNARLDDHAGSVDIGVVGDTQWLQALGVPPSPVQMVPAQTLVRHLAVAGPASGELLQAIQDLHVAYHRGQPGAQ